MITTNETTETTERRCLVCRRLRPVADLADAIAHAPCDQRMARVECDSPEEPGFWGCIGWAGYDA